MEHQSTSSAHKSIKGPAVKPPIAESAPERAEPGAQTAALQSPEKQALWLQRTVGNARTTQLLTQRQPPPPTQRLQRWPWTETRTDRQLVADAIRTRSVADAQAIRDLSVATEPQKIDLIDILSHQSWVGPNDETQIERLWESFGRDLGRVMDANAALWHHCIAVGAELNSIPAVRRLRAEFRRDVQITATGYLAGNRTVVQDEMRQYGISEQENEPNAPISGAQEQRLRDMQQAARMVAQLQRGQEDLQRVYVGRALAPMPDVMPAGAAQFYPVHFDPVEPPEYPPGPSDRNMRPWATVKAEYDRASGLIAALTDRYPALYAISREGRSAQTQQFAESASPAAARAQLGPAMRSLLNHIANAQTMLREGDIDPLDLLPIHEQLFAGRAAASGTSWGSTLPHWAAEQEKSSHAAAQFWTRLGLTTLSAAAFMLAPFTGGASLFVTLVGLGAAGAQAAISAERYQALAAAARTEVRSGTALVTAQQVTVAEMQMQADQVALAIAALLVAAGAAASGASAISRALAGRTPTLRMLLGEARYAEYAEAIEAIKAQHPQLGNIATEDLIAIRGYTAEDYAELNLALRSGDPAQIARVQAQIQGATSGLRQLPAFRGQVNRAVSLSTDMAARYQPGSVVTEPAFTSASMAGGTYQRGGNVLMIIESTTGRDVSLIARHVTEREVLFMPGTRFRVVSVEANGHMIRMVDMGP